MRRNELWQLIIIHFKELLREPGVLFWGIGFPILMAWGLGIAFTGEKETKKDIAIVNFQEDNKLSLFLQDHADRDDHGRFLLTINDPVFGKNIFRFEPLDSLDATLGVKRGIYQLMMDNKGDSTVFYLDPANPEARLLQLQIATLIGERHEDDTFSGANTITLEVKGTRYIDFLVPGTYCNEHHDGMHVGHELDHHRAKKGKPAQADDGDTRPPAEYPSGTDDRPCHDELC